MQADDYTVEEILKESRRFMVPLYQRKYQWADERIDPFWEDVEAKAMEVVDAEAKFDHYMGALIISHEPPQIALTPKVQVVDGQQRLTTFQLFLAALREVARERGCHALISHVAEYLFNQPKAKDEDDLTRFKLTPTPSDRVVFHDIIDNEYKTIRAKYSRSYWGGRVPKNTQFRALRAYEVFRTRISDFALEGTSAGGGTGYEREATGIADVEVRLEALLTALLVRMKLVVIQLDESDDAQVIFETLNSKGEPLLAMDLVRNNIFHRAEREGASVDNLYHELWDPFDDPWWRSPAPFARPRRPRIDHFLAHSLAAETGEGISMRELYAEYRAFAIPKGKPRFASVEDELRVLQDYAPRYETLEGRKHIDETLSWLGAKFSAWQMTTAYPVAMQLLRDGVSPADREQISRLIYSYVVRRALAGLTSRNLNRAFQGLCDRFNRCAPSVRSMKAYFSSLVGDSTRFPSDDEFRQGIVATPVYLTASSPRVKDILWELELASRTKHAEKITMPTQLWIEHVLPVTWNKDWPFEDGMFVEQWSVNPKAQDRDRLLHTLGNLSLLSDGLNISSGNKRFSEKKALYGEHTGLFLNRWFVEKCAWTEAEIRERGTHLADLAIHIWPSIER